ncbi:serine hydrolase [Peristeroidobacter soli]|uniref:serine hydrolase n=1 Tax=Peristeroidobacter soli TaxID=2497877 RepID=UPI00101D5942|nr:serine hydrolase [Peristeroidobacter soli]
MSHIARCAWRIVITLCFVTCTVRADDSRVVALDGYIEQARRDWQVPGVAVGVVLDGEVVFARGYGAREIGKPQRLDTQSLFEIGSLTKAVTAAALALLVEEGRIRWDDLVIDHLPAFRLSDPWVTSRVTVRDLLANRVGFEGGTEVVVPMTARDVLNRTRILRQFTSFRDSMLYSNSLYDVAGELVSAVSGMSWAQFVEQRLFAPLRMKNSFASVDTAGLWRPEHLAPSMYGQAPAGAVSLELALNDNVSMPHWHAPPAAVVLPWQISLQGGAAAGSAVSNLDDLLQWTRWHLSDGQPMLRQATLAELHTTQTLIRESPSSSFSAVSSVVERVSPSRGPPGYALGWFTDTFRGYRYIDHGGALLGAMSLIAMIPERRMGVVVLANSYGRGGHGLMNSAIAMRILDALLEVEPHDWSGDLLRVAERAEAEERRHQLELQRSRGKRMPPSLPLREYAGPYRNAELGEVGIEHVGNELFLRLPGVFRWRLEPWRGETFRLHVSSAGAELMQFFVTFGIDPQGRVASFDPGWALLGESLQRVR